MAAHMQNPGVQAGASRNQLGGWLHITDTLATELAQPPTMPRLIALHLGVEALAVIAMGSPAHV